MRKFSILPPARPGARLASAAVVRIVPDHATRRGRCGAKAPLPISVPGDNERPLKDLPIGVNFTGDSKRRQPTVPVKATSEPLTVAGASEAPGLLRCNVGLACDGKMIVADTDMPFEPENIRLGAICSTAQHNQAISG